MGNAAPRTCRLAFAASDTKLWIYMRYEIFHVHCTVFAHTFAFAAANAADGAFLHS